MLKDFEFLYTDYIDISRYLHNVYSDTEQHDELQTFFCKNPLNALYYLHT